MLPETGITFIENSKYQHLGNSPQSQGAPHPVYEAPIPDGCQPIQLPHADTITIGGMTLRDAVEKRASLRKYSTSPISLEELSYLLWLTQGVKRIASDHGVTFRNVPSAGCRHPFETYLSINNVTGLKKGLYRFHATTHSLLPLMVDDEMPAKLSSACLQQAQIATGAVTFAWAAHPYRTAWRYDARAYRYLFLDAGHICQNLHLAAEAIDCGVCAIGAFDDDQVNQLLNLDGIHQMVIYLASLGKRPEING